MIFLSLLFSGFFTLVELNCENLFDYLHDEGKQDEEFMPDATRHWTKKRYWRKLNNVAQTILSVSDDGIPDLIALCEVENDVTMNDLTKRSLLRNAGYEYLMTTSPDERGIDVALLYSPFTFSPISTSRLRVRPIENMRATRDILYVCGQTVSGDTLHVYVIHAPSRHGGEKYSRPFRQAAMDRLTASIDSVRSVSPEAKILITGDFNDTSDSPVFNSLHERNLQSLSQEARGDNGVKGTYRYKGEWGSIDHVFGSPSIAEKKDTAFVHAPLFLLEEDSQYGGFKPRRTYNGMRYKRGYSDHLPLVVRFRELK